MEKIFVCGGDLRSKYIAECFCRMGKKVYIYGTGEKDDSFERIKECSSVVLGLPALKGNSVYMPRSLDDVDFCTLLKNMQEGASLFGGRFSKENVHMAQTFGIGAYDYSEDEVFQTENAFYTAEGTVCAIVENTHMSLADMKILVIGGGRIAKAFCRLVSGAPCKVDVYARREVQRLFFSMMGNGVLDVLENLGGYDVIVNTVPADVFSQEMLCSVQKDSLVIDLSARPGYVPKDICQKLGIKLLYLPGIPLTSAPYSAGIAAARAVQRIQMSAEMKSTEGT